MKIAANLHLHVRPLVILIWSVSTTLLISLGVWQLNRADEKEHILHSLNSQPLIESVGGDYLQQLSGSEFYPHQVKVKGYFSADDLWVLDNQVYQHQLGGRLVKPFILPEGDVQQVIFVDFGWLAYTDERIPNPSDFAVWASQLATANKLVEIKLYVQNLNNNLFKSNLVEQRSGWQFVGQLSTQLIQNTAKTQVLPILGILDEESPYALLTERPLINMPPAKHTAYAVQWFLLAIALNLIILIKAVSWKKQTIFN
ncbi:hypothetical protein DS2_16129 [Catenovulum agarivorans DS-2]|uniref:SURF1-like protein n=1 Tax=Catenovulum agarivorans DS-2 TaxID=1328313 RepID=W7Q9P3_9ALTE|nr:SURF1 family protein [Catenovulum agarivorans]EWH08696.1 hypothetical protein DS2_16129 [Catenovulum agarivorans DS-2]